MKGEDDTLKLLPCPFCGGPATPCSPTSVACGLSLSDHAAYASTIEAWNRRSLPAGELDQVSGSPAEKPSCGRCRFWDDESCLRFPPQVVTLVSREGRGLSAVYETYTTSEWPQTGRGAWCGEFAPRTLENVSQEGGAR